MAAGLAGGLPLAGGATRSEFWQLLVYCSPQATGNPTGVVFPEAKLTAPEYQRMAASLGYPDTVFLTPTAKLDRWKARAFSPAEELALCTQGLIAAYRVIERKHPEVRRQVSFTMPAGTADVTGDGPDGIAWVSGPYRIDGATPAPAPPFLPAGRNSLLVDTGRLRLLREYAEAEELESLRPEPEAVFAFCRAQKISGLVLFARTGADQIRLRVFTTSLDGREDASTGGAVMAIPPALAHWRALSPREASQSWTVQQGTGPAHRRGTLHARLLASGRTSVGGHHRLIATGHLLPD